MRLTVQFRLLIGFGTLVALILALAWSGWASSHETALGVARAVDDNREMALVAEQTDAATGQRSILGVGRLAKIHQTRDAEFALIITDACQRRGLGTQLLRMLIEIARDEGIERIVAAILPDNHEMIQVARKCGFEVTHEPNASEWQATLRVPPRDQG